MIIAILIGTQLNVALCYFFIFMRGLVRYSKYENTAP